MWSEVTDEVVRSFPVLVGARLPVKAGLAEALRWGVLRYRKVFFKRAAANLAFSQAAGSFLRRCGVCQDAVVRTYEVVPQHLLPPPLEQPSTKSSSTVDSPAPSPSGSWESR